MIIRVYKTNPKAKMPTRQTEGSACWDVSASIVSDSTITCYDKYNVEEKLQVVNEEIRVKPYSRVLVPTNLIFDIPEFYSIRLHPRSGLALKQGLTLVNCEGVIDSDYINPLFVAIINMSALEATIKDGDRIAQLELFLNVNASMLETSSPPQQKSSRTGGFCSTGV